MDSTECHCKKRQVIAKKTPCNTYNNKCCSAHGKKASQIWLNFFNATIFHIAIRERQRVPHQKTIRGQKTMRAKDKRERAKAPISILPVL